MHAHFAPNLWNGFDGQAWFWITIFHFCHIKNNGATTRSVDLSLKYRWFLAIGSPDSKWEGQLWKNIRLDYLKRLNEFYNKWIDTYKDGNLLIIDCDNNKFAENEETLRWNHQQIDSHSYTDFSIWILYWGTKPRQGIDGVFVLSKQSITTTTRNVIMPKIKEMNSKTSITNCFY